MLDDLSSIRRLMDQAPAGIAVLRGREHVFELVNARYEALAGHPASWLVGKRVADALPGAGAENFLARLDRVFRTREAFFGNEIEVRLPDGAAGERVIYVDAVYEPLFDEVGEPEGVFLHATDVTEKVLARRAAEELARDVRAQRDLLQQVLDVLPLGIAIGDATGAITHSNAEARRIWGQPPVPGGIANYAKYGLWSIEGEALEPEEIAYSRSLLKGETVHNEQMLVGNQGTESRIPILQNSAPLRDDDGNIAGAVVAFTDITRLKALERQRDEFLGLVSHELRTPLTTILGYADALVRHEGELAAEDVAAAHLDIAADSVRLQQIVENMLVLSRLESRPNVDPEPVSLPRLIERALADHCRRYPFRKVHFEPGAGPFVAEAVPSYVTQVVGNLLSNAEKYGPAAEAIEVTLVREPGMAVARVLDRGVGISAAHAGLVFDSYYRIGGSEQRADGLGLGLAVCKRLVEVQGGRIWCAEREGGGTEFGFSLPLSTE